MSLPVLKKPTCSPGVTTRVVSAAARESSRKESRVDCSIMINPQDGSRWPPRVSIRATSAQQLSCARALVLPRSACGVITNQLTSRRCLSCTCLSARACQPVDPLALCTRWLVLCSVVKYLVPAVFNPLLLPTTQTRHRPPAPQPRAGRPPAGRATPLYSPCTTMHSEYTVP